MVLLNDELNTVAPFDTEAPVMPHVSRNSGNNEWYTPPAYISAARKLRDAGIPIHPGESVGYVITNAKAKDNAQRITIGGEGVPQHYDLKEYVKRLRDAGKEVSPF